MKKRILLATVLMSLGAFSGGWAQQPAAPSVCDLTVGTYRELNTEANARLAAMTAQAQTLDAKVKELSAQIEKRKAEDEAAKAPPPKK